MAPVYDPTSDELPDDLSPIPVNFCPTCGVDVTGCMEMKDALGRRMWRQKVKVTEGATGLPVMLGGLSHIERGERCLSDWMSDVANERKRSDHGK